jgi:hypothetical protein
MVERKMLSFSKCAYGWHYKFGRTNGHVKCIGGVQMYLKNVTSHKRPACNRHKIVMFLLHFAFKSLIDMSPSIVARNLSIITINKKPNE